jgi:tRNA 2-thiouridine synthesizing protein A
MGIEIVDTLGMKGTQSLLKIALASPTIRPGDVLEIWGDCPSLEQNIRIWCGRVGKTLLSVQEDGKFKKKIRIGF